MANALTRFGNHCRDLRIVGSFSMGDQAQALDCEVHYISAIETGKIAPPTEYLEKLRGWLKLNDGQYEVLLKRTKFSVVDIGHHFSTSNHSTSMRLFRKISKMDPTQIRKFREKIDDEDDDD